VFGHITPEGVLFFAAAKAGAVGIGLEGGDVLPALDRFAVITQAGAALGFGDQQRQVGLNAAGEAVIQGGVQLIHGRIGLIRQQEGTAEVQRGFG
jgi:hypothetical protein